MDLESIILECKLLVSENRDIEYVLAFLKSKGVSKGHSIFVISKLGLVPDEELKSRVHTSQAWSEERAMHEDFHQSLIDSVEKMKSK